MALYIHAIIILVYPILLGVVIGNKVCRVFFISEPASTHLPKILQIERHLSDYIFAIFFSFSGYDSCGMAIDSNESGTQIELIKCDGKASKDLINVLERGKKIFLIPQPIKV